MTTRYYGIPGVLLDRPFGASFVQTVLYNTPGPPFTVARLGPRKLARAIFTRGPNARLFLNGFSEDAALTATHAIWGFMALFEGCCPEDSEPLMYPFFRVPKTRWNKEQVLAALRKAQPHASEQDVLRLRSGIVLDEVKQHYFRQAVPKILANDTLRESLHYFLECARSFQGFMSDSYYHYHYRHDRSQLSNAELRRRYMQHRARYEGAFVSGFKAIERLLGGSQFKAHEIPALLRNLGLPALRPEAEYVRRFEIFRGLPSSTTCAEAVHRFLDVRNVVAAHANRSPPAKFAISEDTVNELQNFVRPRPSPS